ncbi:LAFA_0A05556g1_1 [Lachancea sp. 'fantastica']|nr:LAFA_0A05556g1_1 [Lachancea sp. 'fantastica']
MDSLIEIVSKTIGNLQAKISFLETQKQQYSDITKHLKDRQSANPGADETQKGLILGEFIISSKIYQNIGYEYYVEKSLQEALSHAADKIRLIDDAVEQFQRKNKEANDTLNNLKQAQTLERDGAESQESADPSIDPAENDEGLPFMEIREELDEDGNVISGSVNPTAGQNNTGKGPKASAPAKIEEIEDDSIPLHEDVVSKSNKALDSGSEKSASEGTSDKTSGKGIESMSATGSEKTASGSNHTQPPTSSQSNREGYAIDPNDIYTFDEIVGQLEHQDLLEDGDIDEEDVNYDFNSYDSNYREDFESDESDESDEYTESSLPSVVPEAARSRFLEQLNALRSSRMKVNAVEPEMKENTVQYQKEGNDVETTTKPILHKDKKVGAPKKSVGFASELEVFEVDNLKHETKANTFTGSSFVDTLPVSTGTDEEGFDADLFAQLIGAKGSEEIHEKYDNETTPEEPQEWKPRVSRFKKDRSGLRGSAVATDPTPSIYPEQNSNVMGDVMERNPGIQVAKDVSIAERKPETPQISGLLKKNMRSLSKPVSKSARKNTTVLPRVTEVESPIEPHQVHEKQVFSNTDAKPFPEQIKEVINKGSQPVVQNPSVNYQGLGENLDDMARAYLLGLYNDDVDDAGTVVEHLEDFKKYNKEAEDLQEEIATFLSENPATQEGGIENDSEAPGENSLAITTDVVERPTSMPSDYDDEDLALQGDNLHNEIAVDYQRLRQKMIASQGNAELSQEELQLEPIDEYGNPVRTSKFKAAKLRFRDV